MSNSRCSVGLRIVSYINDGLHAVHNIMESADLQCQIRPRSRRSGK